MRQSLATLYGNNQDLDAVALHWIELNQRSMGDDLSDPTGGKREILSIIAGAMLGGGLGTIPKNTSTSLTKTQLIDELLSQGVKITRENLIGIKRLPDGRTVWLEIGTANGSRPSGLKHIIADHGAQFAGKGISEVEIPDVLFTALRDGKIVGYQGKGMGRPVYEYSYKGKTQYTAIPVSENGFIVGANPSSGP